MFKKLIVATIFLLLGAVATFTYQFDQALKTPLIIEKDTLLTVKSGSSISSFSRQLVNKKWISTRWWLISYSRIFAEKSNIKAGTYLVNKGTTLNELLLQVVEGKEHQFSVVFIEGTRFQDALVTLRKHPYIQQTLKDVSIKKIAEQLSINSKNPEGWLFPDTYSFTANTKDITLLQRAYLNMKSKLNSLWESRAENLPYKNAYEALIMASIIEKETSYIAEQPTISSVFVNRLRKKMRLQTDPTIIYGLGDRYKGDITRAHKREKTAYNTYRINGLPPTPIAMAGLSALEATLHPTQTDYFYFVSNANGRHVFSKTLKEHNAAVQDYLKKSRNKNKLM